MMSTKPKRSIHYFLPYRVKSFFLANFNLPGLFFRENFTNGPLILEAMVIDKGMVSAFKELPWIVGSRLVKIKDTYYALGVQCSRFWRTHEFHFVNLYDSNGRPFDTEGLELYTYPGAETWSKNVHTEDEIRYWIIQTILQKMPDVTESPIIFSDTQDDADDVTEEMRVVMEKLPFDDPAMNTSRSASLPTFVWKGGLWQVLSYLREPETVISYRYHWIVAMPV